MMEEGNTLSYAWQVKIMMILEPSLKSCVGELIVKELQSVDMLAPNVSALHYSQGRL